MAIKDASSLNCKKFKEGIYYDPITLYFLSEGIGCRPRGGGSVKLGRTDNCKNQVNTDFYNTWLLCSQYYQI